MRIIGKQLVVALRERRQAVEEAGRRHRQADARLLRHEAGDRRGVAGVLLMAERDHAHARGLRLAREVGDRDAGQTEDRVDAVELEGIDDQVKAVGLLRLIGHSPPPPLVIPGAAVLVSLRAAVTLSMAISSFTCTSRPRVFSRTAS